MNELEEYYYKLTNLRDFNLDLDRIKEIVEKNKSECPDLERMCKVLSNNIKYDLKKEGIKAICLNTNDFGIEYEHQFLIAYKKESKKLNYYLIDPTYSQFIYKENHKLNRKIKEWPSIIMRNKEQGKEIINDLEIKGYSKVDEEGLNLYLSSFGYNKNKIGFKDVLFNQNSENNRRLSK